MARVCKICHGISNFEAIKPWTKAILNFIAEDKLQKSHRRGCGTITDMRNSYKVWELPSSALFQPIGEDSITLANWPFNYV